MKAFAFYYLDSGLFTGSVRNSKRDARDIPAPEGCGIFEGPVDPLSQRVDLKTGLLVDYQPDQPSSDHEWDSASRRWLLTEAAAQAKADDTAARRKIAELEQSQARRVRELLLKNDPQLKAIDDQIAALRPKLLP
jgi:hypothetical protein